MIIREFIQNAELLTNILSRASKSSICTILMTETKLIPSDESDV